MFILACFEYLESATEFRCPQLLREKHYPQRKKKRPVCLCGNQFLSQILFYPKDRLVKNRLRVTRNFFTMIGIRWGGLELWYS